MTALRRRILEELQRRNFSETTIKTYLRVVEDFARYFGKRPDRLDQHDIRKYQVHLLRERKLTVKTVRLHTAALRFFYVSKRVATASWYRGRRPSRRFLMKEKYLLAIRPSRCSNTLFKKIALFTALARSMVIPTYWLAYHYQWTEFRFSVAAGGNVGPNVSPLMGYVGIPVGAAIAWILISLVVGGGLGSIVIKLKRKVPARATV